MLIIIIPVRSHAYHVGCTESTMMRDQKRNSLPFSTTPLQMHPTSGRQSNKFDSTYVKKKWKNRHSHKYRCHAPGYGGWWTPPWTANRSKQAKKDKVKELRQYYVDMIDYEESWEDCEFTIEDDILWFDDYDDIPIWTCPTCTYNNIERLAFCSMCNNPYNFNVDEEVNNNDIYGTDCELYWKSMKDYQTI